MGTLIQSLTSLYYGISNLIIVAKNIRNEGTIPGLRGMDSSKKEVEVEVGSPEEERFRKVINQLLDVWFALLSVICNNWIDYYE